MQNKYDFCGSIPTGSSSTTFCEELEHSRGKEDNQQQTQPMLGCIGKENEKEERKKKKQKQKYTFYYRLHYKFFSIIHPADEWLILL